MLDRCKNGATYQIFFRIPPDANNLPFSDEEACHILNLQESLFLRHVKNGYIKRSNAVHYRLNLSFYFIGFYDLFEYSLRRNFFFLNYSANHPIINELIGSLVDEMASIVDLCSCQTSTDFDFLLLENIRTNLFIVCRDNIVAWRQYWLINGDSFSEEECVNITLQTWNEVYDKVMNIL